MKQRFLIIVFLVALTSCGQSEVKDTIAEPITIDSPNYTGAYEKYYPNNTLRIKGIMKDGKREGSWKYYFDNGIMWSNGYFKNGVQHGPSTVYYPTGVIKMKGTYENGQSVGEWSFWREDGSLIKTIDAEKEEMPELD